MIGFLKNSLLIFRSPENWIVVILLLTMMFGYKLFPPLYWVTSFGIVSWCFVDMCISLSDKKSLKFLGLSVLGTLIIATIILLIFGYIAPDANSKYSDDAMYYRESAFLSEVWRDFDFPDITRKGSLPYLGTLHTGYHRILALFMLVFGQHYFVGILLNLCVLPLIVLSVWCAMRLLTQDLTFADGYSSSRLATVAVVLAVLHPSLYSWIRCVLKDSCTLCVFLITLSLILYALKTRRLLPVVSSLLMLSFLFIYRFYAGVILLLSVLAYVLSFVNTRKLFYYLVLICLLLLWLSYSTMLNNLLLQFRDSAFSMMPNVGYSPWVGLKWFTVSIPRFFLAPYAWIKADTNAPIYYQYPGMWYLYLLIYPLAILGCITLFKQNAKLWTLVLVTLFLHYYLFTVVFCGDVTRQRFYLEYLFIFLAAVGIMSRHKKPAFLTVWGIIGIFAIIQTISYYGL